MPRCDFCKRMFPDFEKGGCLLRNKVYCPDCQEEKFGYRGIVIQELDEEWIAKNLEAGMRIMGKILNNKGGEKSDIIQCGS